MTIEKIDRKNGEINLTMSDTELRTITNLFCKTRKHLNFNGQEYFLNAELFTAITILHHGLIPDFEFEHIKELYEKGSAKYA